MAQIEGSVAERTFLCQTVRLSSLDLTNGGCFACGPDPLWQVGRPDCADRPGRGTHDRSVPAKNDTPSSPERSQEPCRKGVTSDFDELFRGVRDYLTHPPARPTEETFHAFSNDISISANAEQETRFTEIRSDTVDCFRSRRVDPACLPGTRRELE